jgi:hypothetical protein
LYLFSGVSAYIVSSILQAFAAVEHMSGGERGEAGELFWAGERVTGELAK